MRLLVSWSPRSSNASATPAISSADWTTFCSDPATRSRRRASSRCVSAATIELALGSLRIDRVGRRVASLAAASKLHAAEQIARVRHLFINRFVPLPQRKLAPFQQREQVGGGHDVERKLLAAAGARLVGEVEPVGRLERQRESLPGCRSSARLPVDSSRRARVELPELVEQFAARTRPARRPAAASGRVAGGPPSTWYSNHARSRP